MNTNTISSSAFPELVNTFWKTFYESVPPSVIIPKVGPNVLTPRNRDKDAQTWEDEFNEEVFRRVKAELEPLGHLFFCEPTRLALVIFDAIEKHSAECKRSGLLLGIFDYQMPDLEKDIAETAERLEDQKRAAFSSEIDFLQAFESGNLRDAEIFLNAVLAKRREANVFQKVEANNWQYLLAVKKGDLAMFVDAWNNRLTEVVVVPEQFCVMLQNILYTCLIAGFRVVPSRDGVPEMRRLGQQAFAQLHSGVLHKNTIEDLASKLAVANRLTTEGFRELTHRTFDEHQQSFLRVDPAVQDIQIIWK